LFVREKTDYNEQSNSLKGTATLISYTYNLQNLQKFTIYKNNN